MTDVKEIRRDLWHSLDMVFVKMLLFWTAVFSVIIFVMAFLFSGGMRPQEVAVFLITGENPDFSTCDTTAATPDTPWVTKELDVAGTPVRIAVASGLGNTAKLLDAIEAGEVDLDFVEIMACPGGCVGGGGQPISFNEELASVRAENLNSLDEADTLRYSHENPDVQKLYADWVDKPLSHTAHEWLHTDQEAWDI